LTEINARSHDLDDYPNDITGEGHMVQHRNLCFVIADGGHARFVRPAADYALHTFEAVDSSTVHKKDHDLVSDRPGRAFESGATGRHAYTPRTDPHELAKERFAQSIARRINAESADDVFNELVVVAPPHVLNELTDGLDVQTKAKLVGSLAKDLVKTPDHELWSHLKEWVRPVHRA
jgi:protein required for attachment to host cells